MVLPGGWNIRIPGGFSEVYEEEGAFLAWDATRNIRVSSFSISHDSDDKDLPTPEEMLADDPDAELPPPVEELERWTAEGLVAAGNIFRDEEDGEVYWVLMGKVAGEGSWRCARSVTGMKQTGHGRSRRGSRSGEFRRGTHRQITGCQSLVNGAKFP